MVTLSFADAERLATMPDDLLASEIASRLHHRLGSVRVASSVHVYPLVTTWARRFAMHGAALIGDTAVGMHPVTAHGFNLGLSGVALLAREITRAQRRRSDWAHERVLRRFEIGHRLASWPIYAATNCIVGLYGDGRPGAALIRHAGIRVARRMPFLRAMVRDRLLRA